MQSEELQQQKIDFLSNNIINRTDTFTIQKSTGEHFRIQSPLTKQILLDHIQGKTTIGTYQLNKENKVKCLVFDCDPEHIKNIKQIVKKILAACIGEKRFSKESIKLEASRYPDPSFHIWIFFLFPIPAKVAKWLGEKVIELSKTQTEEIEIFPKQTTIGEKSYGNCIKLPFGFHQEKKKWSTFLDLETFQPLSKEQLLDVKGCVISDSDLERITKLVDGPKKFNLTASQKLYKRKNKIRPCIREALKTSLNGAPGHKMRLAITAEYIAINASVEEVSNLFKSQKDFNQKKTKQQVEHATKTGYKPFQCKTIKELGYCLKNSCSIFCKRRKRFLEKVNALWLTLL